MKTLYDVIRYPVLTEASAAVEDMRKYTFFVDASANKKVVRRAVEKIFDVKVIKVNVINVKPSSKKFKGVVGSTKSKKKAIVTLDSASEINFSKGVL